MRRQPCRAAVLDLLGEDGWKDRRIFRAVRAGAFRFQRDVRRTGILQLKLNFTLDLRRSFAHTIDTMALTRRQKEVLDFLSDFIERNRYSPSYEEIAEGLSLNSLATIHKHISALESKGYLRRAFNQSRSLEIAPRYQAEIDKRKAASAGMEVPLLGKIAAGLPVETPAQPETLHFQDFTGNADTYALQVRGESMIEDHICHGDYVLIQKTQSVKDGDIVVALVEGMETTLKRLYREPDGRIRLQPANAEMDPIYVPAFSVQVQGKLLAVLRKY
jgi:repressor LexA